MSLVDVSAVPSHSLGQTAPAAAAMQHATEAPEAPAAEPEAGTMLDLLCTVAGRETKPSAEAGFATDASDASLVRQGALEPIPQLSIADVTNYARTPSSAEAATTRAEVGLSANERLAKALAGVGAAGSLARIRQQSVQMNASVSSSAPPPKRQRAGY